MVINLFFGGMGAGFYILYGLLGLQQDSHAILLTGPLLALAGLAVLGIHSPRPLREMYVFKHIRRSWMSREAWSGLLFIGLGILNAWLQSDVVQAVAQLLALVFIFSQGMMLYSARAIDSWHRQIVPVTILTSAFANGAAVVLVFLATGPVLSGVHVYIVIQAVIILNLVSWVFFAWFTDFDQVRLITPTLRSTSSIVLNILCGHLLPLVCITLAMSEMPEHPYRFWLIAALILIPISGWAQKFVLIKKIAYLCPISLNSGQTRQQGLKSA